MKKLISTVSLSLILAFNTPLLAMDEGIDEKSSKSVRKSLPRIVFSLDTRGTPAVGAARILELVFGAVQKKLSSTGLLCNPQEVIDLLIGASNGCNIATMIGFGKPLPEIVKSIEENAGAIYPQDIGTFFRRLGGYGWKARYHSQPYEEDLKEIYVEDTLFSSAKPPICLLAYCPAKGSYVSIDSLDTGTFPEMPAWCACRAATGHPKIYTPRELKHKDGPMIVQDAFTGPTDPTIIAFQKAQDWYSGEEELIFVSIGIGPQEFLKLETENFTITVVESSTDKSVTEAFLDDGKRKHHYFGLRYMVNELLVPDTVDSVALAKINKEAEGGVEDTSVFSKLVDALVDVIIKRAQQ